MPFHVSEQRYLNSGAVVDPASQEGAGLLESYLDDTWQEEEHTEENVENTDCHLATVAATKPVRSSMLYSKERRDQIPTKNE